jgi:AcrR family transcriptional regulator
MRSQVQDGRSMRAAAKRRKRRAQILRTAEHVFATKGYYATSIADVIDAAAISRGTLYLYFDGKAELFHVLVHGFVEKLLACVQGVKVSPDLPTPTQQMYDNIQRVVDLLVENHDLTTVLLREAVGVDDEVDRKLAGFYQFLQGMLVEALQRGAEMGIIRPVNAHIVSTAMIGSIKEVLYHYLVVSRVEIPDKKAMASALYDFILRGLLPENEV